MMRAGPPNSSVSVSVAAVVHNPQTHQQNVSNDFNFTFKCNGAVPRVYPRTYADAMLYVAALRRQSDSTQAANENEFPIRFAKFRPYAEQTPADSQ